MKKYLILTALLCLVMILLPFLSKINSSKSKDNSTATITDISEETNSDSSEIQVMRSETGEKVAIGLFDYLVGTVAGEMPASFSTEALKAQAVVSYTYARWLTADSDSELDYITDSSSLHQKYIDETEQKEKWKDTYDENRRIIQAAVKSVYGEYLTYNGETAMTVFHALSNGSTLSSSQVWGEEIPYLTKVNAPGDTLSEKYESEIVYSYEELKSIFETEGISFDEETEISVKERDSDGYTTLLSIGEADFSARDIRRLLSLPGNSFTVTKSDENYIFTVHGRGHGVGMSQYSADYMARQGNTYKEILSHFYPGTELVK